MADALRAAPAPEANRMDPLADGHFAPKGVAVILHRFHLTLWFSSVAVHRSRCQQVILVSFPGPFEQVRRLLHWGCFGLSR